MQSRYDGFCHRCHQSFPAPRAPRTNRKPGECDKCGVYLAPGEGRLWKCLGSSGCWKHWDTEGRWHVSCLDEAACNARVEAEKARKAAALAAAEKRAAEIAAVRDLFQGESPDVPPFGQIRLDGEEHLDTASVRIYGGGKWFVIEPAEKPAPDAEEIERLRDQVARADAPLVAARKERDAADAAVRAWAKDNGSFGSLNEVGVRRNAKSPEALEEGLRLVAASREATKAADQISGASHEDRRRLADLEQQAFRASYPRSIWFVQNNGADGDCWAHNNVRTGGAGAVGWRLPWTEELEARVRAIEVAS